jgi:hypothetical protein
MKPWKVASLILFALVVAAAGYGLILVRRGFSALVTPSAVEESQPQPHAKWPCHPGTVNCAIPSRLQRRTFGKAWSTSPIIAPRAIQIPERATRYSARPLSQTARLARSRNAKQERR